MKTFLTCPCCAKIFNTTTTKEPVFISCCGETVCKECFNDKMKQEVNFKCSLCESTDNV